MNREGFLETVRRQYFEEINEAFVECEHDDGRTIDYPRLNQELKKLMTHALAQGLPGHEFQELVRTTLPHAWSKLDLGTADKAAA
jgi:hypothetical protein